MLIDLSFYCSISLYQCLLTLQRETLHLHPVAVFIAFIGELILNWHSFWKVKLCAWLVILDDCFVVRHGSISCSGEGAKMFGSVSIKADLCYELVSIFGHSIETCLVGAFHKFSFLNFWNFFFDVDHVRKIQI